MTNLDRVVSVIGLGYVGLPLALTLARQGWRTVGFDIDQRLVAELQRGEDRTGEVDAEALARTQLQFTADPAALRQADFHVIAVPTPIDEARRPDLGPLQSASRTLGAQLKSGDIVVYESTVYPGCTRDECLPILEEVSGLRLRTEEDAPDAEGVFGLGYSPERINPGDKARTIEKIVKIVAGSDAETTETVTRVYGSVIEAGLHIAPSIEVAEAAKVIENTQRDVNIALMNEFALIFDRLGLSTREVLAAAGTKWNFLPFTPGLVGGHCIGVDPYYLTTKAEAAGYLPQVILSGRRINDSMGGFVAQKALRLLALSGASMSHARVGVLGLTFKENVADLRNSRVPDILAAMRDFGVSALLHDPHADPVEVERHLGLTLSDLSRFQDLDMLILAVPHDAYLQMGTGGLADRVKANGVIVDVKSKIDHAALPSGLTVWSL